MQFDQFVGQVQHRARLASSGEAIRAIRATLTVLGERLFGGETNDLASQLPEEIKEFLPLTGSGESFDVDEFFERVSVLEGIDLPQAVQHVRAVLSVLNEAVSNTEIQDVLDQLPEEYQPLFTSGWEGEMRKAA